MRDGGELLLDGPRSIDQWNLCAFALVLVLHGLADRLGQGRSLELCQAADGLAGCSVFDMECHDLHHLLYTYSFIRTHSSLCRVTPLSTRRHEAVNIGHAGPAGGRE